MQELTKNGKRSCYIPFTLSTDYQPADQCSTKALLLAGWHGVKFTFKLGPFLFQGFGVAPQVPPESMNLHLQNAKHKIWPRWVAQLVLSLSLEIFNPRGRFRIFQCLRPLGEACKQPVFVNAAPAHTHTQSEGLRPQRQPICPRNACNATLAS